MYTTFAQRIAVRLPPHQQTKRLQRVVGRRFSWHAAVRCLSMQVQEVLELWDNGLLSNGEVLTKIVDVLNRSNIDEVVAELPVEWRDQLVAEFMTRAAVRSPEDLIDIVGGVLAWEVEPDSAKQARMREEYDRGRQREREHYWNEILPAIRGWLAVHEQR